RRARPAGLLRLTTAGDRAPSDHRSDGARSSGDAGGRGGAGTPRPPPANSYCCAELVRCTLRARHPRTSSRAGRWPRADRVGTRRTVARRPRPSRGRQATASRTRTPAPTSYGARYEFGTGVRVGVADADAGALRASDGGTAPG